MPEITTIGHNDYLVTLTQHENLDVHTIATALGTNPCAILTAELNQLFRTLHTHANTFAIARDKKDL